MRVRVYLHGQFKDTLNKEYVETEAKTVYEAVRYVDHLIDCSNNPPP